MQTEANRIPPIYETPPSNLCLHEYQKVVRSAEDTHCRRATDDCEFVSVCSYCGERNYNG